MNDTNISLGFPTLLDEISRMVQKEEVSYPNINNYRLLLSKIAEVILSGEKGISIYVNSTSDALFSTAIIFNYLKHTLSTIRGGMPSSFINISVVDNLPLKESVPIIDNSMDISIFIGFHYGLEALNKLSLENGHNLIVFDTFKTSKDYPFLINVNAEREHSYSISCSKIVLDFVENIERTLSYFIPEYKNSENYDTMRRRRSLYSSEKLLLSLSLGETLLGSHKESINNISLYILLNLKNSGDVHILPPSEIRTLPQLLEWGIKNTGSEATLGVMRQLLSLVRVKEGDAITSKNISSIKDIVSLAKSYQNDEKNTSQKMFRVFKILSSFSMDSKHIVMDYNNRKFVKDAFSYMKSDSSILPLSELFSEGAGITTTPLDIQERVVALLEDLISSGKANSELSRGTKTFLGLLTPSSLDELREALGKMENIHSLQLKRVASISKTIISSIDKEKKERKINYYNLKGLDFKMLASVGESVSQQLSGKPIVLSSFDEDNNLIVYCSGKYGENILFDLLSKEKSSPLYRGVMGGLFVFYSKGDSVNLVKEIDNRIASNLTEKVLRQNPLELVSLEPLTVSEFLETKTLFMQYCDGVAYYKDIYAPVYFDSFVVNISDGEEDKVMITAKDSINEEVLHFSVNEGSDTLNLMDSEETNVLIMKYKTNGESEVSFVLSDDVLRDNENFMLLQEAKKLGIRLAEGVVDRDFSTLSHEGKKEQFYYYIHPESGSAWSQTIALKEEDLDGLIEEVSEKDFENAKMGKGYEVTECEERISLLNEKSKFSPMGDNTESKANQFIATSNKNVLFLREYTLNIVEENPDKIFVFGDNLLRRGKGGQAIIRDFNNALGVPTKRLPAMTNDAYFEDREDEKRAILLGLDIVFKEMKEHSRTIVFPLHGLGTGRAKMMEKSPELFKTLTSLIRSNFTDDYMRGGENSPTDDARNKKTAQPIAVGAPR